MVNWEKMGKGHGTASDIDIGQPVLDIVGKKACACDSLAGALGERWGVCAFVGSDTSGHKPSSDIGQLWTLNSLGHWALRSR